MPGDSVRPGDGLNASRRVKTLGQTASRLEAVRDQLTESLTSVEAEVETLTSRLEVLAQVSELFRALMDKLVLGYVQTLESVVTEGLHTIFEDQDLGFEAEVTQKYNKIAIDFFINQERGADKVPIRGRPMESFGGGPTSIASFVLRVLALLRLKRYPVLLLDETFSAVSDEYVVQTGRFLRQFSESTGIDILLVTHKQAFTEHAAIAYLGSEKPSGLSLEVLRKGASA